MGNKPLDEELLKGYFDNLGKAIVGQMLDLYKQQAMIYLNDIAQANDQESQILWQECCHKMKGAAGSVGLKLVHGYLVKIEKSTEQKEEKNEMLIMLTNLNEEGIAAFTQWLSAA